MNSMNFPYINCKGLATSGFCLNTISSYSIALVDCSSTTSACNTTLKDGNNDDNGIQSYINC